MKYLFLLLPIIAIGFILLKRYVGYYYKSKESNKTKIKTKAKDMVI